MVSSRNETGIIILIGFIITCSDVIFCRNPCDTNFRTEVNSVFIRYKHVHKWWFGVVFSYCNRAMIILKTYP